MDSWRMMIQNPKDFNMAVRFSAQQLKWQLLNYAGSGASAHISMHIWLDKNGNDKITFMTAQFLHICVTLSDCLTSGSLRCVKHLALHAFFLFWLWIVCFLAVKTIYLILGRFFLCSPNCSDLSRPVKVPWGVLWRLCCGLSESCMLGYGASMDWTCSSRS